MPRSSAPQVAHASFQARRAGWPTDGPRQRAECGKPGGRHLGWVKPIGRSGGGSRSLSRQFLEVLESNALISASPFVMLYLENSFHFAPASGKEPQGTIGHPSTATLGAVPLGAGPEVVPPRLLAERVSASGGGGSSLALVPAAGGRAVCLLLRRRHIVCVRRGERGRRRCRFHHRYSGSRQARLPGGGGWPRRGQPGAAAPGASNGLRSALRLPLPPLYTQTNRGACNPPGRPGATPQPGAGGRDVGAEADAKVGTSLREPSLFGERGLH